MSVKSPPDGDIEEEPELSPRAARAMRVVLWAVVAVMAAGWIFLFYNVATRSFTPTSPPVFKPAEAAKPAEVKPAAPAAAKPSEPEVVIETPVANAEIGQPFEVKGWAVDKAAPSGTGISLIHVHAFAPGGGPQFLGQADYGIPRPDVGQRLGRQAEISGYKLNVGNLAPGKYDIRVYAFTTVGNRFVEAVVSVTVR